MHRQQDTGPQRLNAPDRMSLQIPGDDGTYFAGTCAHDVDMRPPGTWDTCPAKGAGRSSVTVRRHGQGFAA